MNFLKVIVNIVAKNPPMALCAFGSIGVLIGSISSSPALIANSWTLVGVGVLLQALYLVLRFR
ncbi:MAG: hypothetical protein ACFFEV_00305 [Candidatus Thorarchaeota archaeon]